MSWRVDASRQSRKCSDFRHFDGLRQFSTSCHIDELLHQTKSSIYMSLLSFRRSGASPSWNAWYKRLTTIIIWCIYRHGTWWKTLAHFECSNPLQFYWCSKKWATVLVITVSTKNCLLGLSCQSYSGSLAVFVCIKSLAF